MAETRYLLVLKGELMDGYNSDEAIKSLAVLFGQPPERLRNIFSGTPITLKQELELPRAQQIQARLHSLGVKCVLAPVGAPPPVVRPEARPERRAGSGLSLQTRCPKCGHHQAEGTACAKCGLVFAKWKEEPEEQWQAATAGGLSEEETLRVFVDANADKYLRNFKHFRESNGFALTWHWPALFVPFLWALYRRMWGWAAVIFVSMAVPFSFIVWPLTAHYIYYRHAQSRLARLGAAPDQSRVAQAGGTSATAVWAALGLSLLAGVAVSAMLLRQPLTALVATARSTTSPAVQASERAHVDAPDTPEGHKTVMVLRATALVVEMWKASGRDVGTVSLDRVIADLQQSEDAFVDGWGNAVEVRPTPENFVVTSAGPDGRFGTSDDIRFEPVARR